MRNIQWLGKVPVEAPTWASSTPSEQLVTAKRASGPQHCTALHSTKKTLRYRHDQSYCFIAASNASGSKSNEISISKLESGSALLLSHPCRRCRCESYECDDVRGICGKAADTIVACDAGAVAAERARGGRNGFFVAAE
jgi:hypothetical protein